MLAIATNIPAMTGFLVQGHKWLFSKTVMKQQLIKQQMLHRKMFEPNIKNIHKCCCKNENKHKTRLFTQTIVRLLATSPNGFIMKQKRAVKLGASNAAIDNHKCVTTCIITITIISDV